VISLVKTFPRKITSKKDIKEIPNIGPAMIQQLEEIVSTGGLRKAQYLYVFFTDSSEIKFFHRVMRWSRF